jgi:hypothetical protein
MNFVRREPLIIVRLPVAVENCRTGRVTMPRRPAQITQAEVARIIRAAKQAGASEVVVKIGEQSVIVKFGRSTALEKLLEQDQEIVL